MLRTSAPLIGALDCIPMPRATLITAFLTGAAFAAPLYLAPYITADSVLVRSLVAMVWLSYIAILVIFVHGPLTWVGWRFVPDKGTLSVLPRGIAWLAGTATIIVPFESTWLAHLK